MPIESSSLVLVLAAMALGLLFGLALTLREGKITIAELWLLLFGVIVFPSMVVFAGFNAAMDKSKRVEFCGTSCHVMQPFYDDLLNPESTNLASIHYQNRYILHDQCYQCHSSYTMFGPLEAKIAGVKHVWNYYTGSWHEPIKLRGTYKISNCLQCHGEAQNYLNTHELFVEDLASGESSCLDCHNEIHPSEDARASLTGHDE